SRPSRPRPHRPDAPHQPHDPRAGRLRRLLRHLQGAQHAAHAADVGHQRDPRDRAARRPARARPPAQRHDQQDHPGHRDRLRHDQRRRRLPGHRPHARDVQGPQAPGGGGRRLMLASFIQDRDFRLVLYILSFALFIYGLGGLTGPRTAVRGNRIAAVGMAVAILATLLAPHFGQWGLVILAIAAGTHDEILMIGLLVAAALLGNFVVLPIGGADMPVVISLLNAFTGLSAAATGVALNNPALIVAGMIVGASGSILTNLMAQAMNRSIPSIVAGGFGGVVTAGAAGEIGDRTVRSTSASDAAVQMAYASQVAIVPGYGMAVAQAQHAGREMTKALEAKGIEV